MLAKPCPQLPTSLATAYRRDGIAATRIQLLALGIALAVTRAGCSSWRPPVVVKVARTINNPEILSSKDYERLQEVTEEAIDHMKGVDPYIRSQLTLSSQKNFVDEIADQTRSGFGPDLLITTATQPLSCTGASWWNRWNFHPKIAPTHRVICSTSSPPGMENWWAAR